MDPIKAQDCKLLCFDSENGKPVPRYSKEQDEWRYERASHSIAYYHLDEGTWNYKRKDLMDEVGILCDRLMQIAAQDPMDRNEYDNLMHELLQYLDSFSEFSSAAWQVVREKGLLEQVIPAPAEN